MKNTAYFTPLFPGFRRQIRRRKPRAARQKLAEKLALLQQKSFKQIGEVFEKFIPPKLSVIHVRHISARTGATFLLPETDGAKINQMVTPEEDEIVVVKNFPNSFRGTSLLELLKEKDIDNLVICGAMSHMCIDATTRAAFDLGFNCIIAEDACATRDLKSRDKTIKASEVHASFMVALSVPYAKVISTKEIIDGLN